MREIKFRFYNQVEKRMTYGPTVGTENASWVLACCSAYGIKSMQFTGLHDLWEEDIIEFRTFDGMGYIGVIKWGEFCYEIETTDCIAPVLYLLPNVIVFESIKKLGNSFENPELLQS